MLSMLTNMMSRVTMIKKCNDDDPDDDTSNLIHQN